MFVFLSYRKNFVGTQKRVRIIQGKRAIGVGAARFYSICFVSFFVRICAKNLLLLVWLIYRIFRLYLFCVRYADSNNSSITNATFVRFQFHDQKLGFVLQKKKKKKKYIHALFVRFPGFKFMIKRKIVPQNVLKRYSWNSVMNKGFHTLLNIE